jgi:hypothetical protein
MQNKLIVPGVKFSLSLVRAPNEFCIMSNTNGNEVLDIVSTILRIRRVNLTPSTLLTIERALSTKAAIYPIFHTSVRTTQLLPAQTQISNFVVHNGQLPRLAIVTTVSSEAYEGQYARNPFNFSLENCAFAQMEGNGRFYPAIAYKPRKSWMDPYLNSLKVVNKLSLDTSTGLTIDDFNKEGHQILAFDLSPDDAGTTIRINPKQNGVLTFNANWGPTDITKTTRIIFYLLWDNTITIDSRKNILLDFIP